MLAVWFLFTSVAVFAGTFSTYLGDAYPYTVAAVATDAAGNTYVVGDRQISVTALSYSGDVFVSKLDPRGSLLFTRTFGEAGFNHSAAIAVDPAGNIYIAGSTNSLNFPLVNALQTQRSRNGAGFLLKLSNDGATILYSTYFGGVQDTTLIASISPDTKGNLFLTGYAFAPDFPHTAGMPYGSLSGAGGLGITGVALSCVSAAGDKILYSGLLAGGPIVSQLGEIGKTGGIGVAVDAAGDAYFVGNIGSSSLPTTSGVLQSSGLSTGLLAKVSTASGSLSYLTYLPKLVSAMSVDPAGNVYLGELCTPSSDMPTVNSLAKVNASASRILWRNDLGGATDRINSVALAQNGNVWATGETRDPFPNVNGWTTGPEFIAGVNGTDGQFIYSARFPFNGVAQSVAVDPSGLVHVAGATGLVSAISPVSKPTGTIFAFENAFGGDITGRVSPGEVVSVYGPGIGPAIPATATPSNGFYPKTLGGVQISFNGISAPLLYASANQINAVVPMALIAGTAATVHLTNKLAPVADYPVWIDPSAAYAFPTVLNQDGSVNSQTNPAAVNSVVTFLATGWQGIFAPLSDGQVATSAQNLCSVDCKVDFFAELLYAGYAPGIIAGVTQLNVRTNPLPPHFGADLRYLNVTGPSGILAQSVWVAP